MSKDEVTTFEHATLKVPYELLNRKFRSGQKAVDREVNQVSLACGETGSVLGEAELSVEDMVGMLDSVHSKVSALKRKATECLDDEAKCSQLCRARLDHLKSYPSGEQTDGMKTAWRQVRVDRMLVDHFLRAGYYTSAYKLSESSGITELVDVDIFMVCQRVEEALRSHDTGPCLAWCYENRSKLRRLKSTLEFQLRLQDFIELVRLNRRVQAIKYARKHFGNSSDHLLKDIQQAMGLLAFDHSTRIKRYQKLFSLTRWAELIDQFRQENFALFQLSQRSVLSVTLQAGLSALKTPQCYKEAERNPQCPVCSKPFNALAKPLPYAHCSQSYLIVLPLW
ncbi:E3 ubiquitin-protein transferase MAEA [Geodia barretti]|uniref:E3 ubiquitin-protein transferase MAEA n=1 Tax=Geodia barretti TaxID=519541 RepID=A0AA35TGE0_GEOBA|nr:E3 ubiquitin-protein transferase MAEA [Geodia barretti]